MGTRLELVTEKKLHKLLRGKDKHSRLEASGVLAVNPSICYVVFDNITEVAQIQTSLNQTRENRLISVRGLSDGFEGIAFDPDETRFYLLIEAIEDTDGKFRALVSEYDGEFRFQRSARFDKTFEDENKGFEGLVHLRRDGREYLWALCEGNLCKDAKKGGGRIQVFLRAEDGNWNWEDEVKLPAKAEFKDYSAIAVDGNRVAVVSQQSKRLWLGEIDESGRGFRGDGRVLRFPDSSYCNVEGVSWLSESRIVTVSDRRKSKKKKKQPKACAEKDQSIHILDIPV